MQGALEIQRRSSGRQVPGAVRATGSQTSGHGAAAAAAADVVVKDKQWTLEQLRFYLMWAKATFQPKMSEEAHKASTSVPKAAHRADPSMSMTALGATAQILQAYFLKLRTEWEERDAARTTTRMLESLVRIAQAHARLCARHEVMGDGIWDRCRVAMAGIHKGTLPTLHRSPARMPSWQCRLWIHQHTACAWFQSIGSSSLTSMTILMPSTWCRSAR